MCGRYASSRRPEDLVEEFEIEFLTGPGPGTDPSDAEPDYNVAPTKTAPVVLERRPRPEPTDDDAGETDAGETDPWRPDPVEADPVRWLRLLTWGLVPSWAKDRSVGSRMINARMETVREKPASAGRSRPALPAAGRRLLRVVGQPHRARAKGKPRKQPFFIHPARRGPARDGRALRVLARPAPPTTTRRPG